MPEKDTASQKNPPKMFKPQEKDPEKMLPAGQKNASLKLFYILILNAIVFGASYAIVYLFFQQSALISRTAAEIVTLLTLIISLVFWFKSRNRG